jgi:hypothetical protein
MGQTRCLTFGLGEPIVEFVTLVNLGHKPAPSRGNAAAKQNVPAFCYARDQPAVMPIAHATCTDRGFTVLPCDSNRGNLP